jgi:molybdopterin synthase catalytic subunit
MSRIRGVPIDLAEVVSEVAHPGAGGIATFVGVVRRENAGKEVIRLEYEAYDAMAERELESILAELEAEIGGVRVAALHRTGVLEIGDVAVVCAASAPHRDEAFTACRLLIDRIKARVPIWKREHATGGAEWLGWEDARTGSAGSGTG